VERNQIHERPTLLRQSRELETMLFKPRDISSAKLKPVEWPHVTSGVLVPRWHRIARENAELLKTIPIESPPTSNNAAIQLGRIAGGSRARGKTNEDVLTETLFAVACGVMTKLIEAGWKAESSPSLQTFFVRGDQRHDPITRVFEIANGTASVAEWAEFCNKEGLSGPLAI